MKGCDEANIGDCSVSLKGRGTNRADSRTNGRQGPSSGFVHLVGKSPVAASYATLHDMPTRQLYHSVTNGVRVTVRPIFAPQHSDPAVPRFVFVYRIRIENVGDRTAQLTWRHWYITDSAAGDSEVEGEGVVGEKPILAPGDVHEYESFCVLESTEGSMAGFYHFQRTDGSEFKAAIPKFLLNAADGPES